MSRRRRKQTTSLTKEKNESRSRLKGLWWKILVGVGVFTIAGAFFAYHKAIEFLHSEAFRTDVSAQVSVELGSEGEFSDFKWDGLSAKNEGFESSGEGAISKIGAKDISLDVELDYIKRDKFSLKNVNVGRVDAELDLRKEFVRFDEVVKTKGFLESLLPDEVELLDAEISDLNAIVYTDSGEYEVSHVSLQAAKDKTAYTAQVEGGMVLLPFTFLGSAQVEKGEFTQLDEEIYVKNTRLKIFDSGEVTLNGVVDLSPQARYLYDMEGDLTGLRCRDVFPDQWHRHLTGKVVGDFKIKPHEGTEPIITGELKIQDGVLQALPILNKISYYLAEPKYRTLNFEQFTCDFEKFRDQIYLRNIKLTSRELVQIEGDLKIDGRNLDGLFDVGVPAEYLSKIPGAKTSVFKPGKDQLLWAKVKIGGDFDDVTEDLSSRLIKAATDEMIRRALSMGGEVISPETIDKVIEGGEELKKSVEGVLSGDKGVVEEGVNTAKDVVEGGVDTAKGVLEGVVGGLTGSGSDKKDKEEESDEDEDEEKKEGGLIPKLPEVPKINDLIPF